MPQGATWPLVTVASFAVGQSSGLTLRWELLWMGEMLVAQGKNCSVNAAQFSNNWMQSLTGNLTRRLRRLAGK
jgi:hypothetical protein